MPKTSKRKGGWFGTGNTQDSYGVGMRPRNQYLGQSSMFGTSPSTGMYGNSTGMYGNTQGTGLFGNSQGTGMYGNNQGQSSSWFGGKKRGTRRGGKKGGKKGGRKGKKTSRKY